MSEPRPSSPRRRLRRLAPVFLAALLFTTTVPMRQAAANEPQFDRPAPRPVRDSGDKVERAPNDPQPTGRLIVRYRDGVTETQRGRIRAADRLEFVSTVALPNTEVVTPSAGGTSQALAQLGRHADVLSVEPEYRRTQLAGPTTADHYAQQWALNNTGQTVQTYPGVPDVDMNVPEAWQITTGDPSLVVAITDSGVDLSHPDLASRAWVNTDEVPGNDFDDDGNGFVDDVNGWDFCDDDNTVFESGEDHGTHVAGSVAASGDGVAGVAPSVKIMAVRFLDDDPSCGTDAQAIAAIAYAADNGAKIINASWGGTGVSSTLREAIDAVPDVLLVAAAGNGGDDGFGDDNDLEPVYPAAYDLPNVLTVAAIHNQGHLTSFTNYGYESVDLSAPGEDILSTLPGDGYGYASGTSMAAPHASGVAALAASAKPELLGDAPALREHLIATAKALPSTLYWVASPRLLDARAAVVDRPDVKRLFGNNRFATAAAVSKATFVPWVPYAFIANGSSFPDALAGGAVAAQTASPLLLVNQGSIPSETVAELQRLNPDSIYVLGGTGVISNTVLNQLQSYDEGGGVYRLAGDDRYGTAASVSEGFVPGVPTAFVANGLNFPDALAGVPASAVLGGPLLLATRTGIPPATAAALSDLQPQRIVVLGGTSMIGSAVASALAGYAPVTRMSGNDRYGTAADVASKVFATSETAFVANGLGFPDALAGGPSGGAFGGPLLLVNTLGVPTPTQQQLQRLQPARIFVLGGTAVVPNAVVTQIDGLFP